MQRRTRKALKKTLDKAHAGLKRIRGRGSSAMQAMAALTYARALESEMLSLLCADPAEMRKVDHLLLKAWSHLDDESRFDECARWLDEAQQRSHRVIRKLS